MINLGPLDIDYDRFLFSDAGSTDDEQLDQSENNVDDDFSNDNLAILGDFISVDPQKNQSPNVLNQEAIAVAPTPGDVMSTKRSNREIGYLAALAASLIFISATTAWLLWKPTPSPEVFKMALVVQSQPTTTSSENQQTNQVRSPDGTSLTQLSDAIIRIESNSAARVFFVQSGNDPGIKLLAGSLELPKNNPEAALSGNDRMSFRLKSFDPTTTYFAIVTPPNTERESVEAIVDELNRTGMTENALLNECLTHVPKYQCLTIAMP